MKKFLSEMKQQTDQMSITSQSRGQYVISILETNINKVLIGPKPVNKKISKTRETLILMIDSYVYALKIP